MKLLNPSNIKSLFVAPLALGMGGWLACDNVQAASDTWLGSTDTNWDTTANWSGGLPASGTTVLFNGGSGGTITLPSGAVANSITFDTTTPSYTLSSGNLTLSSGGTVQIASTITSSSVTEAINSPISLAGGYTFANNSADSTDVLDFGGAITNGLASGTDTLTLTGANTGNNVISGAITNNGSGIVAVSKTGNGNWILTGPNTFTGTLAVSQGTLTVDQNSGGSIYSSGTLSLSGGTFVLNGNTAGGSQSIYSLQFGNYTFSNLVIQSNGSGAVVLSDTGSWNQNNAGSLLNVTLTGNAAFTVPSSISSKVVNNIIPYVTINGTDFASVTSGTNMVALASGSYTTLSGANPVYSNGTTQTVRIDNTSTGSISLNGATQTNSLLVNDSTPRTIALGGNNLNFGKTAAIFTPNGTGALAIGSSAGDGTVSAGGNTANSPGALYLMNYSTNGTTNTVNSNIVNNGNGAVTLYIAGPGAWTLAGANTYTGATSIGALTNLTGTLNGTGITVQGNGGFNETATGMISGASSLSISSGTGTLAGNNTQTGINSNNNGSTCLLGAASQLNLNSSGALSSGTFYIGSNSPTIDNTSGSPVILASGAPININSGYLNFGGSGSLNLGTGAVTLSKAPIITLGSGNNTTLTFGGQVINPSSTAGVTVKVNNGTGTGESLVFNNGFLMENGGTGGITDIINGTGNVTINGTIADGSTTTGNVLSFQGSGMLTLNGNNTFSGGFTLTDSGTIGMGSNSALGTGPVSFTTVATLFATTPLTGVANSFTADNNLTFSGSNNLTISGPFTNSGGSHTETVNNTGLTTLSGPVYLSENTTGHTVTINGSGNMAISGPISNWNGTSGSSSLVYAGTGILTLSGSNSYTGTTKINSGTVQFAQETSLYGNIQSSWTATNIAVSSGATVAFNVGGTGEFTASDIQTLTALGTSNSGFENNTTIGLDTSNAANGLFVYSNAINNPNSNANVLGVTKLGNNGLSLAATSAYTGTTTIAGGALYADATKATGAGPVVVVSGSLGGSGTIRPTLSSGNAVTVTAGGILAPGDAPTGTSVNGNLTLDPSNVTGSTILLSVAASSSPLLRFALGTNGASQLLIGAASANTIVFNVGGDSSTSSVVSINDLLGADLTLGSEYTLILGNGSTTYTGLVFGPTNSFGEEIVGGLSLLQSSSDYFSENFPGSQLYLNGDSIDVEIASAVPEPNSFMSLLLGAGSLVLLKGVRRRRLGD